jgi:hypothetical protein
LPCGVDLIDKSAFEKKQRESTGKGSIFQVEWNLFVARPRGTSTRRAKKQIPTAAIVTYFIVYLMNLGYNSTSLISIAIRVSRCVKLAPGDPPAMTPSRTEKQEDRSRQSPRRRVAFCWRFAVVWCCQVSGKGSSETPPVGRIFELVKVSFPLFVNSCMLVAAC